MRKAKKYEFSRCEPEIPEELADSVAFDDGDDIAMADWNISGAGVRGRTIGTLRVESSVLTRVNLADSSFGSIILRDVRLVGCELANLRARRMSLLRVEFIDCRMTGLNGGEIEAQDVLIREGDQRYSRLRASQFRSTEFDGCNLEEAELQDSDFSGCMFRRCNMRGVEMGNAKLKDADLRGSVVEGLNIGLPGLRGAVVDPAQAMLFALLLGIRIE